MYYAYMYTYASILNTIAIILIQNKPELILKEARISIQKYGNKKPSYGVH